MRFAARRSWETSQAADSFIRSFAFAGSARSAVQASSLSCCRAGARRAIDRTIDLLDRAGRIKPCGGAIPPKLVRDFDVPDELLVARVGGARIVSPSARTVDMPIDGGWVGMVDRDVFDEWLRNRAAEAGATGKAIGVGDELEGWLRDNATTPGGFTVESADWSQYARSVARKIQSEVAAR